MKYLFYLTAIFVSLGAQAQNYSCFTPGTNRYFINGNGYLRGMCIDSIRTVGDTTIFYPFHKPRCGAVYPAILDSNGGGWLGKRVLALSNGKYIFDNLLSDLVVIQTRTQPGDSWTFYRDRGSLKATVLSADTLSVAGGVDSPPFHKRMRKDHPVINTMA